MMAVEFTTQTYECDTEDRDHRRLLLLTLMQFLINVRFPCKNYQKKYILLSDDVKWKLTSADFVIEYIRFNKNPAIRQFIIYE